MPRRAKTSRKGDKSAGNSRRLLGWLFHPLALKTYLLLVVLFAAWVIYLDATIRSSFEGKKWQLPARVYARPLELYHGLSLTASELENELRDLGYKRGSTTRQGTYFRNGSQLMLHSRGHQFWDGKEPEVNASLVFSGGRIASLQDLAGKPIPLVRLEPMEIGAIYPSHREDRVLVKVEEVPPLLLAALVAVEDHRFYQHHGISPTSVLRAALQNIRSAAFVQGGSTLTQQLVKNYYLTRERSLSRKFTEAIMALLLELHYEKEDILEAYLNEVYLGQSGAKAIHGFGLAAQHYFNRPLEELSMDRLALLIAIVRGPTWYDPWRYPERALKRRNLVLDALVSQELLTEEDAQWAREQPIGLGKSSRSLYEFPAYIDLVRRQLRSSYDSADLTSNGLKIYTSFDPRIQRSAERAVASSLSHSGSEELEAAVVVAHPATGEVLALVGGSNPRYAGFNRALDARRSIGSLVKPFVYIPALGQPEKYTLATLIDDSPISIESAGKSWSPRNYDRESHGMVPMITALARSYNQATARLGNELGVGKVVDVLNDFGLQREIDEVPALFIGSLELSPLEVAGLYQSIAAHGFRSDLKAIRSVQDSDGEPLKRFPYRIERATSEEVAYLVENALVNVGRFGSARYARSQLGSSFTFAGKTGTSNQQRDSWFAGFTGDLLAVAWLGRDDNTPTPYTGSSGALPLWTELVKLSSKQPLDSTLPDTIEQAWIDTKTGGLSRSSCQNAARLSFIKGSKPAGRARCSD